MKQLAARLLLLSTIFMGAATAQMFPEPILAYSQLPKYPPVAVAARIEGSVELSFLLNERGDVLDMQVVSGHPMLKSAAVAIVKTWRFDMPRDLYRTEWRYETEFVYRLDVQHKKGAPKLTVTLTDFRRIEVTSELYVEPIE